MLRAGGHASVPSPPFFTSSVSQSLFHLSTGYMAGSLLAFGLFIFIKAVRSAAVVICSV